MFSTTGFGFGRLFFELESEWNNLLKLSTRPSIYSTFEYISLSIKHFEKQNATLHFVVVRDDKDGELVAIFPMSIEDRVFHTKTIKVLQHCITTDMCDVDKPYPIINKDLENQCWLEFKNYFSRQYTNWDWLEYEELIPESALNESLKQLYSWPKYYSKKLLGPASPLVSLQGLWSDFEAKHRNMRKKERRLKRKLGDKYRYVVYSEKKDMQYCLESYVKTETEGWKSGDGVSEKK